MTNKRQVRVIITTGLALFNARLSAFIAPLVMCLSRAPRLFKRAVANLIH